MFTDIRRLRVFLVVAEEMSFTAAAERLNMAQPWVSVQVKQLEESLNMRLFDRHRGSGMALTCDGEELFAIDQDLVEKMLAASDQIKSLQRRTESRVALGVDPITLYIPDRNKMITRFMGEAKKTNLKLVSQTPAELFAGLRSRELDLILTSVVDPSDDFEILPLYEYELKLAVPKTRTDLIERPIAEWQSPRLLTLPDNYHPTVISWLKSLVGTDDVEWVECPENSYHALIKYSLLFDMPTLTPDFSSSISELHDDMVLRPISDPPAIISWGLMRLSGFRTTAVDRFWNFARNLGV